MAGHTLRSLTYSSKFSISLSVTHVMYMSRTVPQKHNANKKPQIRTLQELAVQMKDGVLSVTTCDFSFSPRVNELGSRHITRVWSV